MRETGQRCTGSPVRLVHVFVGVYSLSTVMEIAIDCGLAGSHRYSYVRVPAWKAVHHLSNIYDGTNIIVASLMGRWSVHLPIKRDSCPHGTGLTALAPRIDY